MFWFQYNLIIKHKNYLTTLIDSVVKNPPTKQKTQVWSLGQEYPMEKAMAIYSSIFAWVIPWTECLAGYSPWGHKWVRYNSLKQLNQTTTVLV